MLPGLQGKKLKAQFGVREVGKGFGCALAISFVGLGHVGVCCHVATAKLQLHHIFPYAVQCTLMSNFQSILHSID